MGAKAIGAAFKETRLAGLCDVAQGAARGDLDGDDIHAVDRGALDAVTGGLCADVGL